MGENYPLRLNKNRSRNNLTFINGEFLVDITRSKVEDNTRSLLKHLYEEWIIRSAIPILKAKVDTYSQKLAVDIPQILIKNNLKSRWASLTRKGTINFNMHLIKAPQDVIDYVVLHELCHMKIKGHSHHYWDLVYRYMPTRIRLIGLVLMEGCFLAIYLDYRLF